MTTRVQKRSGHTEEYDETKVDNFIQNIKQVSPKLSHVDTDELLPLQGVPSTTTTPEINKLVAETAAALSTTHPQYGMLAGRIIITDLHKKTPPTFSQAVAKLGNKVLNDDFLAFVEENAEVLDNMVKAERDFTFDIFAISTLQRSYLLKDLERNVVERPQYLWMRVAVALHMPNLTKVEETYTMLSTKQFTHATPTLFNSGTRNQQLASCFLLDMDDSIDGIYSTLKDCAIISKNAGGLGLNINKIRGTGAPIHGTNGISNGIVPMLKVFEATAEYCDQGGGKRKGSCATYIQPHHPDIIDWLMLRRPDGIESRRCRSLFYGLWVSDLFMRRVQQNGQWSLIDNTAVPELETTYGEEFEAVYEKAERDGKAVRTMPARELFNIILESQIETGTPYILFKDAANRRNNQKAAGVLTGSNLCCEIMEYKDRDEIAVCTLASICLPACIRNGEFDFQHLRELVSIVTKNLNITIDRSTYPVPQARYGHLKRRPIGIGVQGLSDVFQSLSIVFGSDEALELDAKIFETIYLQAMRTSCDLAKLEAAYTTFQFSPLAKGQFQFDLYDKNIPLHYADEWEALRADVMKHGVYNSLLIALMPTASSAQIVGNSESFEVRTSNCYVRRTLGGEFVVVNPYLFEGRKWTEEMSASLIENRGSVQKMDELSAHDKAVFRTVYEIKMKDHIRHAAVRQPFVDQSQSMNLYFAQPSKKKLMSALFYGWQQGLKTGAYYMRRQTQGKMMGTVKRKKKAGKPEMKCDEEEVCVMCSS